MIHPLYGSASPSPAIAQEAFKWKNISRRENATTTFTRTLSDNRKKRAWSGRPEAMRRLKADREKPEQK
jgi:hypothetical protein